MNQGGRRNLWIIRVRRIAILLSVVCAIVVGGFFHAWSKLNSASTAPPVSIEISRGASTKQVLSQLGENDLLPSVVIGRIYLEVMGKGRSPRWGRYSFEANSRPVDVLEAVLDGRVETFNLTILEGAGAAEIGEQIKSLGLSGAESWGTILRKVEWITDLAPAATSLEGFLFPDTYSFHHGTDATTVAKTLVERFRQVWTEECRNANPVLNSLMNTVILASLVEAETSVPEERPRVAGVFTNRLGRGMLLQCDPTVVFALKRRGEWTGRLLRVHWDVDDPYNTYRFAGLPPGPINNPGRAALAAAISPESHTFLYFVAQPGGVHAFSRTLKEHNRAVARLRHSRH